VQDKFSTKQTMQTHGGSGTKYHSFLRKVPDGCELSATCASRISPSKSYRMTKGNKICTEIM